MNSLPHSRNQEQGKQWISPSKHILKKNKNGSMGWKDHGQNFLRLHGIIFLNYLEKGKTITAIFPLYRINFSPNWWKSNSTWWRKKFSSPWKCTNWYVFNCHGQSCQIGLQIAPLLIIFSRFGLLLLFHLCKHEEMTL